MSSPSDKEVEEQLVEAGKKLADPPSSLDELLSLLDNVESCLTKVEQSPAKSIEEALFPAAKALVADKIFKHPDADVKVAVATCISEITRITAPDAPYGDGQMKDIFELIVSSFENLSDLESRSFSKRALILETVAKVRSCVMMLDLECDSLIVTMFQHFFREIRDHHSENVFSCMETIMTLVIEESEDISPELLLPILASVKKEKEGASPIAKKLGVRVLEKSASKLKPYVGQALKSLGTSVDDYSEIVASICQEPAGAFPQSEASNASHQKVDRGAASPQKDPFSGRSSKFVTSNGAIETNDNTLANSRNLKKQEHSNPSLLLKISNTKKEKPKDLNDKKVDEKESKPEETVKRKGKKPNLSAKLVELGDASQDENENIVTTSMDGDIHSENAVKSPLHKAMDDESKDAASISKDESDDDEKLQKKFERAKKKEGLSAKKNPKVTTIKLLKKEHKAVDDAGEKLPKQAYNKDKSGSKSKDGASAKQTEQKKLQSKGKASPEDTLNKLIDDAEIKSTKQASKKEKSGSKAKDGASAKLTQQKKAQSKGKVSSKDTLNKVIDDAEVKSTKQASKKEKSGSKVKDEVSAKPTGHKKVQSKGKVLSEDALTQVIDDAEVKSTKQASKKEKSGSKVKDGASAKLTEQKKTQSKGKVTSEDTPKSSRRKADREILSSSKSSAKSGQDKHRPDDSLRVNSKRKRSSEEEAGARDYGEDLVGSKIKVWWPIDKAYYEGVVASYNDSTKKHRVDYVDGDKETLNLKEEKWQFVAEVLESNKGEEGDDDKLDDSLEMPLKKKAKSKSDVSASKQAKTGTSAKKSGAASTIKSKVSPVTPGSKDDGDTNSKPEEESNAKSKDRTPSIGGKLVGLALKMASESKNRDMKTPKVGKSKDGPRSSHKVSTKSKQLSEKMVKSKKDGKTSKSRTPKIVSKVDDTESISEERKESSNANEESDDSTASETNKSKRVSDPSKGPGSGLKTGKKRQRKA